MRHHDEHEEKHQHDHGCSHPGTPAIAWIQHFFIPRIHGQLQAALGSSLATDRGLWALKVSLSGLLITAIFQVVMVIISGSIALLADTIHNFFDALTAIPFRLAF